MSRPKGSLNKKPKLSVVGNSGPGVGHNALSDEAMQALHLNNHVPSYERALKAKKDADAAFKNVCKLIKAEGGTVAAVKLTLDLRTPEGEAKLKAQIEESIRVARWSNLPVGTQGDIFGPDRRPPEERAFDEGKLAGMSGKDCKPPHAPDTEAYNKWVEGWHHGQSVLGAGIKQKPPEAELLRKEGVEQSGVPDEFDEAAGGSAEKSDAGGDPWPDDKDISKTSAESL
ncbi:hypothetical protein [Mesorhizobium sp.]|uniref:hypothetical protein n=1 Tax=Mesorhizobium sp. TaxID=1871066 RepID=UPI00121BB5E6|nr:hypothetical protein [Mesorhizobium sp.]TIX28825.1 MAG: hypothetical protein E5V35_00255 [Mesorhizobium sp.]